MTDSSDPPSDGSAADDSASAPSPQWCAKQWSVLCDVLDVSDPTEVVPRVKALQTSGATEALSADTEALLDQLDAASPAEARKRVTTLIDQMEQLYREKKTLADAGLASAEAAVDEIDRLEKKCVPPDSESPSTPASSSPANTEIADRLGIDTVDDAQELEDMVRRMTETLGALQDNRETLRDELGVAEPRDVLDLVRSLQKQLEALYDTQTQSSGAQLASQIEEILGISSVAEAKDLAAVAENMSEQLEALYEDRAQLQEVGVSSVESAVEMIQSMSTQLDELYEDQELLQGHPAPDELKEQDTFEQLAALYAEQEKLERALGVSEADAIIEMVEGLKDQLEAFSSDRDETSLSTASSSYSPRAVEDHTANGTEPEPRGPISLKRLKQTPVFTSMRDQLESLYEEKEALLNMGIDDVQTAAGRIDELEARLSTLQHKHEQCRDRLEHLRRELGTANVEEIVDLVSPSIATPASHGSTPPDAPQDSRPEEDVPTVLPQETLTDIDDRPEEDLDALSVGVLRLDDDGAIEYLNEAALALPGLDAASPRADLLDAFFFQAVPSTSNTLFLNRFRTGVDQAKMDVRFPYTFVSPQHPPTAFYVHLYRSGPSGANWIFLRPVR